jgi:isopentenyl phosphate kinase
VKLGGSLLTDKAREQAFRPGRAARLMRELAAAGGPLVLVHGAGSFGHPQARRHKAALAKPGSKQGLAVATILESLRELSAKTLAAAERAGLETSPINVDGRGLDAKALREVKAALAVDRVPVLHGTLVLDGKGWRVLGGDELMAVLALALKPERAVWASDVAGVYDRDPRAGRATLLGEAKAGGATTGRGADVTGRMAGKLAWAAQVAAVCPTWIVGGHVPGRLGKALGGTPVGTRVLA